MPTVMLVDDEDDIRDLLELLLRSHGYDVIAFSNGQEALDHLRSHRRPCVVLLDLMMPVMDGRELLAHVADDAELANLPIVVTSAAAEHPLPGVRRFLRKPFGPEAILRVVEEQCGAGDRPPVAVP